MKRRMIEWVFVSAFLIILGYVLRVQPMEEEFEGVFWIATDLSESTVSALTKDLPGSYQYIYLSQLSKSQWKEVLDQQKADLYFGSQDLLLWAARNQKLQPVAENVRTHSYENRRDSLFRWVGIWFDPWVVAYNNERLPQIGAGALSFSTTQREQPQHLWTVPDMGNPNGDRRNVHFYRALFHFWGKEVFFVQMSKMRPNIQNFVDNTNHGIRMVLLGQSDFSFALYSDSLEYQKDQLPISWTSLEVSPAILYGAGVGRDAKQKEQANRMIEFWQTAKEEWNQKVELPWLSVKDPYPGAIYQVSGLNDQEDITFLNKWLADFRFGSLEKGFGK